MKLKREFFMLIRLLITVILEVFFCSASLAVSDTPSISDKINRVIYITLDGVRWQDVYLDHSRFPKFWKKYASKAVMYGTPLGSTTLHTASVPVSLPSYQSQMAGSVQPCADNHCGMIQVETLPERLIHRLHLPKKNVATFSSWPEIGYAVEHIPGTTYSNTGNKSVKDPDSHRPDSVMAILNQKQRYDHPEGQNRYDKYTFAQAWHYFVTYDPRFIWIALDDADEAAHSGDIQAYHRALSYYDELLDIVLSHLKAQGIDKETLVIITTDHGRGIGRNWTEHGLDFPESRQIWGFVMNGQLVHATQDEKRGGYSLLSIRPTVERTLGCIS